jgi:hypothetical protein
MLAVRTRDARNGNAAPGPAPAAAPGRLAAVHATQLLDAEAEESFDRLTRLAQRLTGAPLGTQNTLEESFCQYVLGGQPLVLADVTADERTAGNPSITGMGVRAWAGFPVHTPDGPVLGSFCVVDTTEHEWTDDVRLLDELAATASREVALRAATLESERARADVWQALITLAVPGLGDFAYVCTVDSDGALTPVGARHRDPARLSALWRCIERAGRRTGESAGPGHGAGNGASPAGTSTAVSRS